MKIDLKSFAPLLLLLLLFSFSSCSKADPRFEQALGTICYVDLYNQGTEAIYDEIFARIDQLNTEFSLNKAESDLFNINHFASHEKVFVGNDVFKVLETAQKIAALTDGAFDVSIEPLVSLWHVNSPSPHVASQSEIDDLLPLVDYKNIELNPDEKSVRLLKPGMQLDFGGIAKGYVADEVAKICKKHKIRRAVIDLGGNVYVYGKKAKNALWNVGVKNPEFPDVSAPLLKISIPQMSVVTSGMYERFFEEGEKRYHHILSPKDGYPIENELASVTVISENSMLADALTTAFFVLGKQASLALMPRIEQNFREDFYVIFIEKNRTVSFSPNFPFEYKILYENWSSL